MATEDDNGDRGQARRARTISRLTVVLPAGAPAAQVRVAERLAGNLSIHGVQVARHVRGGPAEGAMRADVALWLPDETGLLAPVESLEASARVHVGLVASAEQRAAGLLGYDAVLVPHEALVEPLTRTAERVAGLPPEVLPCRLPLLGEARRDEAKAARRVQGQQVALIDLHSGFERDAERVLFQLALASRPAAFVLRVPHDDRSRARLRQLCERHSFEGWMTSGPDAIAASVDAIDVLIGRPGWLDLLLAASEGVDVGWLESDDVPLDAWMQVLVECRAVFTVGGVLQLGAALDRRLEDVGGSRASATLLAEQLIGEPRALLRTLGEVREQLSAPRGAAAWERVGPEAAAAAAAVDVKVDARSPDEGPDRAERIEDELAALKARLAGRHVADEGGEGAP
jgi:hypothetical protein